MRALIESNIITELEGYMNFAYIFNNHGDFLSTEYKVLQSQGGDDFVKCMKMEFNGQIQMFYLTSEYKSFNDILPTINIDTCLQMVSSLIKKLVSVKANGFLDCQNIDTSFDKIFIDPLNYNAHIVYLPIRQKEFNSYFYFENNFRQRLIDLISSSSNLYSYKCQALTRVLSDSTLSLEDLIEKIQNIKSHQDKEDIKISGRAPAETCLYLVSVNSSDKLELAIDKDEFVLGKDPSFVDGIVDFSKAISRKHCKINKIDETYYVTDLASKNGTYHNKVRLKENEAQVLKEGDYIRLANYDLKVVRK